MGMARVGVACTEPLDSLVSFLLRLAASALLYFMSIPFPKNDVFKSSVLYCQAEGTVMAHERF